MSYLPKPRRPLLRRPETPPVNVDEMLAPREVAAMFRVDPRTVTRWAKTGKLRAYRTVGGHARFSRVEVEELLRGENS